MRLSLFGLGYVGAVSVACFAKNGHTVIGVDPNADKLELIRLGRSPIIEPQLGELLDAGVRAGRIQTTSSACEAVLDSEVSFVCVGTPSAADGAADLSYIEKVCREIGAALKEKSSYHVIVIRSTLKAGTTESLVIPTLEEASGKKHGEGFGVVFNPEFLREATSVIDFYDPPKTVIGGSDERALDLVAGLYSELPAALLRTSYKVAEMVKVVDNVFHALKVSFANEIGNIAHAVDVDSHEVMDIFCQDYKLNLSPYYLKPGFAFGGSCLPKDLRALNHLGQSHGITTPILANIFASNETQIQLAFTRIMALGLKRIGVLGISFKAGTDDLRESPLIELLERLLEGGCDLRIYDQQVNLAKLIGSNKAYIDERIPRLSGLMVAQPEDLLRHAELVIVGNKDSGYLPLLEALSPEQHVFDLVRLARQVQTPAHYEGLSW